MHVKNIQETCTFDNDCIVAHQSVERSAYQNQNKIFLCTVIQPTTQKRKQTWVKKIFDFLIQKMALLLRFRHCQRQPLVASVNATFIIKEHKQSTIPSFVSQSVDGLLKSSHSTGP